VGNDGVAGDVVEFYALVDEGGENGSPPRRRREERGEWREEWGVGRKPQRSPRAGAW
jgi:hypothetical protein